MRPLQNIPLMATAHILFAILILMVMPSFAQNDDPIPTVSSALVVTVNEDSKYTFDPDEFKFQHATQEFAKVIITRLPSAGSLTLEGSSITMDQNITVADLDKLTYQPKANDFGKKYATFKYRVVGNGTEHNTSIEYTATINVTPVNDKPTAKNATFTVEELSHTVAGGPIEVKDVSNERNIDTYTYILEDVAGSDYTAFNDIFEIIKLEDQNATIKVKSDATLNYNSKCQYVVYATVKDNAKTETKEINGPQTSAQFKITVNVKNENNTPTIDPQTFTKTEKQINGKIWPAGTSVGKVTTASDPDGDPLTYSVITAGVPFKFENGSNELVITDGSVLDFETKPTWTMKVQVSDGELKATATVTIRITNVNEGPEDLILSNEYSVDENTATGKSIGSFTVVDPDDGDMLIYSLTRPLTGAVDATTAKKNMSDIFVLKESTNRNGTRTVLINVKNGALLDYEKLFNKNKGKATYQVSITASDTSGLSITKTTNIVINDVNEKVSARGGTFILNEHSPVGSPVCAEEYKDAENNPLSCDKIARVEGSDLDVYSDTDVYTNNDTFNTLTYQIISSKNTGTDYTNFTVDPNTGVLYTNNEFDYESGKHRFTFIVTVSDGSFTADAEVNVNIDDIEEHTNTTSGITVEENTAENENVIDFREVLEKIKTDDEDIRNELAKIECATTFTLDQEASGDAKDIFKITNGIIKVADPTKLDFETLYSRDKTTLNIVIVVSGEDSNGNPVEVSITVGITVIDINESPEITNDTPLSVPESYTNDDGTFGNVTATDKDNAYSPTHPWGFNKLTYKVEEVIAVNGSTEFPFEINPNTGAFTVADGKKLNYTKQKQYKCIVKVIDNPKLFDDNGNLVYPALSTTKTIVINVTDVNRPSEFKVLDNPYEIEENVDEGTALDGKQIVIYDEDDADFDQLAITITDKNATATRDAAKLFEVVQAGQTDKTTHLSTFVIKTKANINYEDLYNALESEAAFDITLTIIDTEARSKYPQQDTRIQVIDVNEEPEFNKDSYTFTIAENTTRSTSLGVAEATDSDIFNAKFGTLYFSLEGDDAAQFGINGSTGEIFTANNAKLNYEAKSQYSFNVIVTDKKNSAEIPVTINIMNVSEGPKFPDNIPTLTVDENTLKGIKVDDVLAIDDDCTESFAAICKAPKYSITASDAAPNDYKSFTYTNGVLKVAMDSIFNYEIQDEYIVHLVATDGDDPTLSDGIDVIIKINDVNDTPTYRMKEYVFDVHENAPVGDFVGSVEADDEDSWNEFTYALSDYMSNSGDSKAFSIDETGRIFINTALNYEKKDQYRIWVKVTDNGEDYGFQNYTATTFVTINLINDPDAPTIADNSDDLYIDENTPESPNNTPNNLEIARFEITDDDDGQTATLQGYLTDAGNTGADTIFNVSITKTGDVYEIVLFVIDNSSFNYETLPNVHEVNIYVKDEDGLITQLTKTINIRDVNERPFFDYTDTDKKEIKIPEDQPTGDTVKIADTDIFDNDGKFTNNEIVALDGDTDIFGVTKDGIIYVQDEAIIDYETKSTYSITLRVRDATTDDEDELVYPDLYEDMDFTIVVTNVDDAPKFSKSSYEGSIDENSANGDSIQFEQPIVATTTQKGASISYAFIDDSGLFSFDPNTRTITLAKDATLDYESTKPYKLKVVASYDVGDENHTVFTDTAEVIVKLNDINEKPVITAAEFKVDENAKEGTVIGTVKVTDPEADSKPTFTLTKDNSYVTISTNGEIKVKKGAVIDYEKMKEFSINVKVTDVGGLSDEKELKIKVNDVKEEEQKTSIIIARDIQLNLIDGTLFTNKAGRVQVRFFDMQGHQVASIDRYISAGTSNIGIENENISEGVYLVQVKFNGIQLQNGIQVRLSR